MRLGHLRTDITRLRWNYIEQFEKRQYKKIPKETKKILDRIKMMVYIVEYSGKEYLKRG